MQRLRKLERRRKPASRAEPEAPPEPLDTGAALKGWRRCTPAEGAAQSTSFALEPAAAGAGRRTDTPDPWHPATAPHATIAQDQTAWELGLRQAFATSWAAYGRLGKSFRLMNADEIYENNALFQPRFQFLFEQPCLHFALAVTDGVVSVTLE